MIHVLIERHIAEDMLEIYEHNARDALHRTYTAPGFISGETFADVQTPNHRFLLCKWRTMADWQRWFQSEERQDLMNKIAPTLQEPERICLLEN